MEFPWLYIATLDCKTIVIKIGYVIHVYKSYSDYHGIVYQYGLYMMIHDYIYITKYG